jgi:putative ABC transport system ATP-binding protein
MSGGERQRLAIARAIAPEPAILLADEPTGRLDRVSGRATMETIGRLRRDHGLTLLLVTHDAEVAAWADRVVGIADGRVVGAVPADGSYAAAAMSERPFRRAGTDSCPDCEDYRRRGMRHCGQCGAEIA